MDTLSSPAYGGRGYLHDADGKTAAYIASHFNTMGLASLKEDYLQPFPIAVDVYQATPTLSINDTPLKLGHEFLPFPGAAADTLSNGVLIDVGDGVFIPTLNHNDYAGKDLQGAIAVMHLDVTPTVKETLNANGKVDPLLLQATSRVEIARHLGAAAVLLKTSGNLYDFYNPVNTTIPVMIVAEDALNAAATANLALATTRDWETTTANVIGYIPGTHIPDQYYLITAHYDHMGSMGPDHYFPGANDNASGVAMTLALAALF